MKPTDKSLPVIQLDERPGSDNLLVAFTGNGARFNTIQPFDFFKLTGLLDYHRILLRDPQQYCYLRGVDESGFDGLVAQLRSQIDRIKPKKVIFIGVSAGGYAALLLGSFLQPDYVHAFSPYTYLNLRLALSGRNYRDTIFRFPRTFLHINFMLPRKERKYLNLQPILAAHPSKTRYYLHACAYSQDRNRALHLKSNPQVKTFLYPCSNHNVTWGMLKNKSLRDMLAPENLDQPEMVYQRYYSQYDFNNPVCKNCLKDEVSPASISE
jgi:hypothetical protein